MGQPGKRERPISFCHTCQFPKQESKCPGANVRLILVAQFNEDVIDLVHQLRKRSLFFSTALHVATFVPLLEHGMCEDGGW